MAPSRAQEQDGSVRQPNGSYQEHDTRTSTYIEDPADHTTTEENETAAMHDDHQASLHISALRELHEEVIQQLGVLTTTADNATGPSITASTLPRKRKASEMGTDFSEEMNDDNDEEDDNEWVPPHKPELETLPRLPVYHPAFHLAEGTAKRVVQIFIDFMKRSGYMNAEATHLLEELQLRSRVPYGDAVRIGLIGEAGVGKSATLNSVLGIAGLTIEGDDGDSCTYVVIEFMQASPTQSKPFGAEIEFFARETCFQMVTDLLGKYVQYKQQLEESADEPNELLVNQASTARECFQQLFANHAEFSDEEAAEEYLSSATSANDPRILNPLLKWTTTILDTFVPNGKTTLTMEANTAAELVERYLPFTRTVPHREFNGVPMNYSPWPLVALVRVRIDSPILKQNIVLADLPGLSDINRFRVDASLRYMQGCDKTIVVAKIDRAEKNAALKKFIMEAFRRRRTGSVNIVITRSDDLSLDSKTYIELDPKDEERLSTITHNVAELDKTIELKRGEIEKNKQSGQRKKNKKLGAHVKIFQKRKRVLIRERLEIRIAARNKKVAAAIAQNYRMDTRDEARVPIFCISNKAYMHYARGYEMDEPPAMSLVATQVPTMRAHIYSLPSMGKFQTLDHFCNNTMHTLLSVIQMSCSTTPMTRKEHLLGLIHKANEDIENEVARLILKYLHTEVAVLLKAMSNEGHGSIGWNFSRSAQALCQKFAKSYSAQGHRAFIRNYGHYKTKKISEANWNEEFLRSVRGSLDEHFGKLHDECEVTLKAEVAQSIKEIMTSLNLKLRDDPQALVCNAYKECFLSNLPRHQADISKEVELFAKTLQRYFRAIHQKSTTTGEDTYLNKIMAPIYEASNITVSPQKGKTLHKARCELFESLVCAADGPFRDLSDRVDHKMKQALTLSQNRLRNGVGNIFDQIRKAFELMSHGKDDDSAEGKAFRKELQMMVEEGKKIANGPIKESLDLCRGFK